jgi:hypothetical protein
VPRIPPVDAALEVDAPRRGGWKVILQIVGFVIGLGLLGWCVIQAFSPENQKQLAALRSAPWPLVAALFATSVLIIASAGMNFYLALRPVRKINFLDLHATNAIAILLAYLPFKLSMVFRVLVHHRRDRLPLALIVAWFACVTLAMLAAFGPLVVASVTGKGIDARWFAVAAAGAVCAWLGLWQAARFFSGERGMERIRAIMGGLARATGIAAAERFAASKLVHNLHDGLGMLNRPQRVASLIGVRLLDMMIQATRFYIAAKLLGIEMTWESAVLIASTHFIIGVVSPSGMMGTREAGAAGLASYLHVADMSQAAAVGVLILATEAIVNVTLALIGVMRLGVGRIFTPREG